MAFQSLSLGERIALAARMAVAAHLGQSLEVVVDDAVDGSGRRIVIGGAGPTWVQVVASDTPIDAGDAQVTEDPRHPHDDAPPVPVSNSRNP